MDLSAALTFARPRRWGVLATLMASGRPQMSNVGYALGEDDVIRISVTASRAKTANARRDPRVSLHVASDDFWSFVVIEGEASLTPVAEEPDDATVDELVDYYRAIQGEHPDWDEYRAAMVADRRLIMRVVPSRAYGSLPSE